VKAFILIWYKVRLPSLLRRTLNVISVLIFSHHGNDSPSEYNTIIDNIIISTVMDDIIKLWLIDTIRCECHIISRIWNEIKHKRNLKDDALALESL